MPEIVVLLDGQEVRRALFGREPITIGRSEDNVLPVEDLSVSRRHARISLEDERYYLSDLDSANGTTVNGRAVTRTRIFHSDLIGVGHHHLLFLAPEAQPEGMAPPEPAGGAADETMLLPQMGEQPYLAVRSPRRAATVQALPVPAATLGRAAQCDVRIVDWFVEPLQARIEQDGPGFLLYAVGAPERVRLNGSPVTDPAQLSSGDVIEMGVTRLVFALGAAEADAARLRTLPELEPVAAGAVAVDNVPEWAGESPEGFAFPEPAEAETEEPEAAPVEAVPYEFEILAPNAPVEASFEVVVEAPEEGPAEVLNELDILAPGMSVESHVQAAAEAPVAAAAEAPSEDRETGDADALSEKDRKAVVLWERALQNPSAVVRKQAAEQLRRLTGRDYV